MEIVVIKGDEERQFLEARFGKSLQEDEDRRCGVVQFQATSVRPARYSVYRSALSDYAENFTIDLDVEDHASGPMVTIKWYSQEAGGCIHAEEINCLEIDGYQGESAASLAERIYNWAREPRTYNQFRHRVRVAAVEALIANGRS